MTKATAKAKAPRTSKQSKRKLAAVMRELEKSTKANGQKSAGSCGRMYCV